MFRYFVIPTFSGYRLWLQPEEHMVLLCQIRSISKSNDVSSDLHAVSSKISKIGFAILSVIKHPNVLLNKVAK